MLPSIENLRCFLAAARQPSFAAGAKLVGLTPAAFGQRIRQLEDQIGVRLFERTTRRVALTEAGHQLIAYADRMLALAAEAVRATRGEIGAAPMELTIGTRHELGMSWLLPLLPALGTTFPELTTHLYVGSGVDLLIRLRTSEIDVAIGSMRVADPRLDYLRLHLEEYVLVGSPRLIQRTPLRTAEMSAAHVLIDIHPELPLFDYLRNAPGNRAAWAWKRVLARGTISAIRAAVMAEEGVAVLPRYLVARDLKQRRLVRLLPKVKLLDDHFKLIFRRGDPRQKVFERLAQVLLGFPLR